MKSYGSERKGKEHDKNIKKIKLLLSYNVVNI